MKYDESKTNLSPSVIHYEDLSYYFDDVEKKVQNDVVAIFFKYIKDNFSTEKMEKFLNSYKSDTKFHLTYKIILEKNGTYEHGEWIMEDNDDFITDKDIANLDMLVRKNMIIYGSGLISQSRKEFFARMNPSLIITFLEKELQQAK